MGEGVRDFGQRGGKGEQTDDGRRVRVHMDEAECRLVSLHASRAAPHPRSEINKNTLFRSGTTHAHHAARRPCTTPRPTRERRLTRGRDAGLAAARLRTEARLPRLQNSVTMQHSGCRQTPINETMCGWRSWLRRERAGAQSGRPWSQGGVQDGAGKRGGGVEALRAESAGERVTDTSRRTSFMNSSIWGPGLGRLCSRLTATRLPCHWAAREGRGSVRGGGRRNVSASARRVRDVDL